VFEEALFASYFQKLYRKLFLMDEQKYLPPKYTYALKELANHYGIYKPQTTSKERDHSAEKLNLKQSNASH
jgi:hypothetical protein